MLKKVRHLAFYFAKSSFKVLERERRQVDQGTVRFQLMDSHSNDSGKPVCHTELPHGDHISQCFRREHEGVIRIGVGSLRQLYIANACMSGRANLLAALARRQPRILAGISLLALSHLRVGIIMLVASLARVRIARISRPHDRPNVVFVHEFIANSQPCGYQVRSK